MAYSLNFLGLMNNCSLVKHVWTYSSVFSCCSIEFVNIYISSQTSTPIRSQNTYIISLCQDEGPLQSPCWRTLLVNVPSGDEKSVLGMSSGTMRSCSYASDMSIRS